MDKIAPQSEKEIKMHFKGIKVLWMDRTAPKRKKSATQGKKSSLKGMSGTKKKS